MFASLVSLLILSAPLSSTPKTTGEEEELLVIVGGKKDGKKEKSLLKKRDKQNAVDGKIATMVDTVAEWVVSALRGEVSLLKSSRFMWGASDLPYYCSSRVQLTHSECHSHQRLIKLSNPLFGPSSTKTVMPHQAFGKEFYIISQSCLQVEKPRRSLLDSSLEQFWCVLVSLLFLTEI